jgi:hypothetical protein
MTDASRTAELFSAAERGDVEAVRALLAAEPGLVRARDETGATALHVAAFHGHHAVEDALLSAGADVNARDGMYDATPLGWATHFLRERGGLLAIEIDDALFAIRRGDRELVARHLTRHPWLADASDRDGTPLADHARASGDAEIDRLFTSHRSARRVR